MKVGMTGILVRDANLRFDSYGSPRPDGKPTRTVQAGTQVKITALVASPKPGQTHPVNIDSIGWIKADDIEAFTSDITVGVKGMLIRDANLKYDSYGSPRPDGKSTITLKEGSQVEVTGLVQNPKPGQTHPVHVNGAGWIESEAIMVKK